MHLFHKKIHWESEATCSALTPQVSCTKRRCHTIMQTAPCGAAPKGIQDLTECPDSTKITVTQWRPVMCDRPWLALETKAVHNVTVSYQCMVHTSKSCTLQAALRHTHKAPIYRWRIVDTDNHPLTIHRLSTSCKAHPAIDRTYTYEICGIL